MWTTAISYGSNFLNYAAFYLPISSQYDGDYDIKVWIPCEDASHFSEEDARYQRLAYGTGAGVTGTMHFDQSRNLCDQYWQIGNDKYYEGSSGGYTRLIDLADFAGHVGVDALYYELP
jgi:hypothetical protein